MTLNFLLLRGLGLCLALAALVHRAPGAESLVRQEWTVGGTSRVALVHLPPGVSAPGDTNRFPVVFAFHGHGGSMQGAARSFGFHRLWPEAIVVYPQGLNTPGRLTDPEGRKPGWQHARGEQGDRDLQFFDRMRDTVRREWRGDARRLYATGHSNGGGFTYLLWAERGEHLAAVAPSASAALRSVTTLPPKPVLHVAGRQDALVKFAWQESMITSLRRINHCGEGIPWPAAPNATLYAPKPGSGGAPVVTYIHPGGHEFPKAAPELIVTFLRQHRLP
jgi:polyhydroxybutyrate depolymerase